MNKKRIDNKTWSYKYSPQYFEVIRAFDNQHIPFFYVMQATPERMIPVPGNSRTLAEAEKIIQSLVIAGGLNV